MSSVRTQWWKTAPSRLHMQKAMYSLHAGFSYKLIMENFLACGRKLQQRKTNAPPESRLVYFDMLNMHDTNRMENVRRCVVIALICDKLRTLRLLVST